ncbi:unnamed protein product, partial [marine sediment metagenome]
RAGEALAVSGYTGESQGTRDQVHGPGTSPLVSSDKLKRGQKEERLVSATSL